MAPWRQVRDEPPLDKAVEAKLLLHRNPDEPTGEVPRVTAVPPDDADDELDGDLSELADLERPARAADVLSDVSGQVDGEEHARLARRVAVDADARACAQPPRALRRSTSTTRSELVARTHEAPEAHLLDATEQRELARVALVAEQRDRARLRERLELDHARARSGCPGSALRGRTRRR